MLMQSEMLLAVCIKDCAIHVISRLLKRLQALYCWVISDNAFNTAGNDRANYHRLAVFYLKIFQLWGFFCLHGVYYRCTQLSSPDRDSRALCECRKEVVVPCRFCCKARQELGAGPLRWRAGIQ